MARTMSPRPSPSLSRTHGRSPSPIAAQPTSKKERKRLQITDRLSAMHDSFEQHHTDHYWAQLSAVQCEINLLMRADPYRDGPLNDSPDGIAAQMGEARKEVCSARAIAPEAEASFQHASGKFYPDFVREVNAALEQRDADLTSIYTNYQNSLTDLKRQREYATQLAYSEHNLLVSTLRERMIQRIVSDRTRLLKEKEQLDIADSNALLLNPAQFSIGNASPSGALNPRKTRNTRLRPGEGDEPPSLASDNNNNSNNNKRKRKAAFETDNDSGSPGPAGRTHQNDTTTTTAPTSAPYKDTKQKLTYAQFDAPLYSVDRLFTDKDLAMNMNRAHHMTAEYFARVRAQGIESRLHTAAVQHATHANTWTAPASDASITHPPPPDDEPPTTSTHATRQRTTANPLTALSDLAAAASTTSLPSANGAGHGLALGSNAPSSLPPYTLNTSAASSKANPSAPPPPSATEAEIKHDLLLMKRGPADAEYEDMLSRSVERPGLGTGLAFAGGQAGTSGVRDEGVGGVEMTRGFSGVGTGGVSMSRGGSLSGFGVGAGLGGVEMRRGGSARGFG